MELVNDPGKKAITLYRNILGRSTDIEEEQSQIESVDLDVDEIEQGEDVKRTKAQTLSSIRAIKSKLNSEGNFLCVDDLNKFVEENSYNCLRDQEFFVAGALLGDGTKENPIVITLTSKTSLNYIKYQSETCIPQFAIDATYKLNELGYPLIVTVTPDANLKIFLTSLTISSTKSEKLIVLCLVLYPMLI